MMCIHSVPEISFPLPIDSASAILSIRGVTQRQGAEPGGRGRQGGYYLCDCGVGTKYFYLRTHRGSSGPSEM